MIDMKLWYPYNLTESKRTDVNDYITSCTLDMYRLKLLLRKNIISERWKIIASKLNSLLHTDVLTGPTITDSYIQYLECRYDPSRNCCFYTVSPFRKVGKTRYNLAKIIRLCEYGNDTIPPTNWVRHTYREFVDIITGDTI